MKVKIRTDFITNSSSSNFLIAFKSLPLIDDDTIKKYPFLNAYAELIEETLLNTDSSWDYERESKIFSSLKEYEEDILDKYSWGEYNTIKKLCEHKDWINESYSSVKKYMKMNYKILDKNISLHDITTNNLIKRLAENNPDFVIIFHDSD